MARSMLLDLTLPKYLWTYAVMSATYVRNCYCQDIDNTRYGLITKSKPNITKFYSFRSVCYSYIQSSKKLDAHSRKGYFVGYDKESPLYVVYYPRNFEVDGCPLKENQPALLMNAMSGLSKLNSQ